MESNRQIIHMTFLVHFYFLGAVSSAIETNIFTRIGSDVPLNCRPQEGVEFSSDTSSTSLLECADSCVRVDGCEAVVFSKQQGVCLYYQGTWTSASCQVYGDWEAMAKGENLTDICQHGGQPKAKADGGGCQCFNGYIGERCERLMEDCYEGKTSGHYLNSGGGKTDELYAQPRLSNHPVRVLCLQRGYTVFQRRESSTYIFNRTWQEYVDGFSEGVNFWMGLQNLYDFTNSKTYNFGVYFYIKNGTRLHLNYGAFRLADNLTFSAELAPLIQGDLSDHLQDLNGQPFSTYDNDNDNNSSVNCGEVYGGGWWFNSCADFNFNGRLIKTGLWSGAPDEVHYKGLGSVAPSAVSLRLMNPEIRLPK